MILLVQVGVLALTVLLWWRVQRDLSGRASAPPLAEWERLRQTVEQLTADLERRAVVAEQRVAAAEASLSALLGVREETRPESEGNPTPALPAAGRVKEGVTPPELGAGGPPTPAPLPFREGMGVGSDGSGAVSPDRFAQAERLIAAGAADAVDIARQTGVSRGEAELLLSLRVRRV